MDSRKLSHETLVTMRRLFKWGGILANAVALAADPPVTDPSRVLPVVIPDTPAPLVEACGHRFSRLVTSAGSRLPPAMALPGGSTFQLLTEAGLNDLAANLTRQSSFFSLFEHDGRWLGVRPLTNFFKDEPVVYFSEMTAEQEAQSAHRFPAPKWAYNQSRDWVTASDEGAEAASVYYRTLIKKQLQQKTRDPRWKRIDTGRSGLFYENSEAPALRTFLDSLLGRYVSGINTATLETNGEKYSLFSGRVVRIFTMKSPEGQPMLGELIYAEVRAEDGTLRTVLLNPHEGMNHDLYVHDYRFPALTQDYIDHFREQRQRLAQQANEELRRAPIWEGKEGLGYGAEMPAAPDAAQALLAASAKTIDRLGQRSRRSGLMKIGPYSVDFSFPTKQDLASLQAGDLLWDLITRRYFVVGKDEIPLLEFNAFGNRNGRARLVFVRKGTPPAPTP